MLDTVGVARFTTAMTTRNVVQEVLAAKTAEHEAKMARYRALLDSADAYHYPRNQQR